MNRAPVRPAFSPKFSGEEHCSSNRFQREQIGYHSHLRIPRCFSQARVYYMRVLSSLSESEIKNVLKIRNGDPILPNEPAGGLDDYNPIRSIGCNFQSERPCSWPTSDTWKGSTGRGRCISRLHERYTLNADSVSDLSSRERFFHCIYRA
jgi:hypothetical protein